MEDYTKNTHVKNHFENGKSEPHVLLESYTDGEKFIKYTSTLISSAIVEYNGRIPDAEDIKVLVWHSSDSVEDPINFVPVEYESIDTVINTNGSQRSLEDAVEQWSDEDITRSNYDDQKAEFLIETSADQDPYCTTLLTCSCGSRDVYDSVSEALGHQVAEHNKDDHSPMIWFYSGVIDTEVRQKANSFYEGAKAKKSSLVDKIRGLQKKDPIETVPIYHTPLSVALQEVGAYDTTEHSTDSVPTTHRVSE